MEIVRIALITAVIGLIALSFLSFKLEPAQVSIDQIEDSDLGDYVKITGQVANIKQSKITQFDLKDRTGEVRVVSFKKLNVSKGEALEVIGKVDEYKGFLEVIAERIKRD